LIKACTPEETVEAGSTFANNLKKGDLVLLFGVLGAGKTTFIFLLRVQRFPRRLLCPMADTCITWTFTGYLALKNCGTYV